MADTVSKLVTQVVADMQANYPGLVVEETSQLWINALQVVINNLLGTEIPLSRTEPDYERVMLQLHQSLSEDPEWYDMLVAGTGHALVRMTASGTSYNQFAIQRALQETFIGTSTSDNSVYAASNMLGVRLRRKLPSRVKVSLTRDNYGDYYEIPMFEVFMVGQLYFFNRDKIVFKAGEPTIQATLYQGLVVSDTLISNGEPFQRFVFGNGTRTASDTDLILKIDEEEWTRTPEGPWQMNKDAKVYYESTSATGDIIIEFGNGDFGAIPVAGKSIKLYWVETLGASGNLDSVEDPVTLTSIPNVMISGETITTAQGGDDEVSANVYRKIAPHVRAANRRAVRRSDYQALALEYAGVRDALFRGQAELAPGRRSMMNVIGVSLLMETATPLTPTQWTNFIKDFKNEIGIYQCEYLRIDPVPVTVNINATVYCYPDASLANVKSELTAIIQQFFKPKKGHLGFNVYLSDISDILNGRNPDKPNERLERAIGYTVIRQPTTDMILSDRTKYCRLGTLNLTMEYTSRGGYQGRLDLSTPTSTT